MKCILIPIDFNPLTQNLLSYVISFSKEIHVDHIILFKNFHVPLIAKVLPDANYVESGNDNFIAASEKMRLQLNEMSDKLRKLVPSHTAVEKYLIDDKWLPAIESIIALRKPDLVILGNNPHAEINDSIIAEKIIPFSKASSVPVLVVPIDAVYKKLNRVLIPTSFENLDRLHLMKKLCISQNWLNATLLVLNVDPTGKFMAVSGEHIRLLDEYLKGYHYQIIYSGADNIVKEILAYAKKSDVQLILALPGKHSFLYGLVHQSVTEAFALNAHHPVLLLK